MNPITLKFFFFKVLLWLPISFLLWYFSYPALLFLSSTLSNITLPLISSHAIHATQLNANHMSLDIITNFVDLIPNDPTGKKGRMAFTMNVMKYGYGLPLFVALVLAGIDHYKSKIRNIIFCIILVAIVQLWGISFEVFLNLNYSMGDKVADYLATPSWLKEVIKLGHHLGTLIIPAVAPMVLWFLLYQKDYRPGYVGVIKTERK